MKRRRKKRLYHLLLSLIILFIIIYNPLSARAMTLVVAYAHGINTGFFYSLIAAESSFRTLAYSRKQAIGLGQVRVPTAKYIYPNYVPGMLWFPPANLHISAIYIKYLDKKYKGNKSLTLAAYNWGETNVDRKLASERITISKERDYRYLFRNVPETYHYIHKILD